MSKLGPPNKTSVACQCDVDGCQLSMTFDNVVYENGDRVTRVWMFGGRPDGQALYILGERERLSIAWMLLIPDKPVPHHLKDQDFTEMIVIELLENMTIGNFVKQDTGFKNAGVPNVETVSSVQG